MYGTHIDDDDDSFTRKLFLGPILYIAVLNPIDQLKNSIYRSSFRSIRTFLIIEMSAGINMDLLVLCTLNERDLTRKLSNNVVCRIKDTS